MVPFKYGFAKAKLPVGMPDQNSSQSREHSTPAPAGQADGQGHSGSEALDPAIGREFDREQNPMQSSYTPNPMATAPEPRPEDAPQRIPYWLQQSERFLRVIVRMYLGMVVCVAPWWPFLWDNNPLFSSSPQLLAFVTHGAVRGLVSGLGLLNLWIAVRDALRTNSKSVPRPDSR